MLLSDVNKMGEMRIKYWGKSTKVAIIIVIACIIAIAW